MKRFLFPYTMAFALAFSLGACSEDEGNYDYTQINEVTIEGIEVNAVYEAGSQIVATPTITVLDEATSNLSYQWTINGMEVSTERILDTMLPPLDYGDQLCALTITDNDTGMQYIQTFNIQVMNLFNYGYYFFTRLDDNSAEMAYIQAKETDDSTVDDVKYTTGVADQAFGNDPRQIFGTYGYNQANGSYEWTLMFLSGEGEYPAIVTDNSAFEPTYLLSSNSFIDQEGGYTFNPEEVLVNIQGTYMAFVSNGQFIYYTNSKLYRPARHTQDYYWSHAVIGMGPDIFAWVFDEQSRRVYTIQAYRNNGEDIPEGFEVDNNAWDRVMEPVASEDNPDATNPVVEGEVLAISDYYAGSHACKVVTAAPDMMRVYTYSRPWINGVNPVPNPVYTGVYEFALPGMDENASIAVGGRTGASAYQYYVNAGNNIYYCATGGVPEAPVLVCSIPAEYGEVEYLGLSALGNRLVVVAYDESSSEERKGTVLFVDLSTRQITHTFPHILHHCSGFWGANDANSTFLAGYGDNM